MERRERKKERKKEQSSRRGMKLEESKSSCDKNKGTDSKAEWQSVVYLIDTQIGMARFEWKTEFNGVTWHEGLVWAQNGPLAILLIVLFRCSLLSRCFNSLRKF